MADTPKSWRPRLLQTPATGLLGSGVIVHIAQ